MSASINPQTGLLDLIGWPVGNVDLGPFNLVAAYVRVTDPSDTAEFFGNRLLITASTLGSLSANMGIPVLSYASVYSSTYPYNISSEQTSALYDLSEVELMQGFRATGTYWAYDGDMEPYQAAVSSYFGPLRMDLSGDADYKIYKGSTLVGVVSNTDLKWENNIWASSYYFGNSEIDGTWRMRVNGGNLVTELREAGVWVEKTAVLP